MYSDTSPCKVSECSLAKSIKGDNAAGFPMVVKMQEAISNFCRFEKALFRTQNFLRKKYCTGR